MELMGLGVLARQVVRVRGEVDEAAVLDPVTQDRSRVLWTMLTQQLQGRAMAVFRLAPRGCGLAAWRLLYQDYEQPEATGRQVALLTGLLEPRFAANLSAR